tara:strand:+ start:670 stop:2766 length:2097 start_codon:yes stop_codon:yes gene_type:complete
MISKSFLLLINSNLSMFRLPFLSHAFIMKSLLASWIVSAVALVNLSVSVLGQDKNQTVPPELPPVEVQEKSPPLFFGEATTLDTLELSRRGIASLSDLEGAVPNFSITSNGLRSFGDQVFLRGIGNTRFFGDNGVVAVVDGVAYGSVSMYPSELLDIESIEILRGNQGHRLGRNAPGGAILIRTEQPGQQMRSRFSATYERFDQRDFRLSTSGPINDNSAYSFSSYRSLSDGFIENAAGRAVNNRDAWGARMQYNFKPSEDLQVSIGFHREEFDDGAQGMVNLASGTPYTTTSDTAEFTRIDRDTVSARIDRIFDWGTFTSITARSEWDLQPNQSDLDLSAVPIMSSSMGIHRRDFSQEFLFQPNTLGDGSWNFGMFYMDSERDELSVKSAGGFPFITSDFDTPEENWAVYLNGNHSLSDSTTLELGLRYDHMEKAITGSQTILPATVVPLNEKESYSRLMPSLGLSHVLNPQTTLFARSSLGYKPGGFSGYMNTVSSPEHTEEKSWQNEFGINYVTEDLTLSLTGFWSRIEDYHLEKTTAFTDYKVVNADKVRAFGVEATLAYQASEGLTLGTSYGYTEAEFNEYETNNGNRVPYVPRFTAGLYADYQLPDGLFLRLDNLNMGDVFHDETNSETLRQVSYSLLNARFGLKRDDWGIEVFADNLTDEVYYLHMINTGLANGGITAMPRTFGISVTKEF